MDDSDKFAELIAQLEAEAASSPAGYRLRLALLGLLGYGFLAAVLLMVFGSIAMLLYAGASLHLGWLVLKLSWVPLVVAGIVLRALWVTTPKPKGADLSRAEYSRLFDMLDEIRGELRSPHLHRVILSREFNAGIVQVPRLGILGWSRNTLSLGLPLMMALRPDSFRAVIAHEMGHLSGNHGAFGAWIYRIRRTWERVLEGLETQNAKFDFGLREFFRWYVPYFDAYSFKLARAQEYVADRCAAEVTSPSRACEALIETDVLSGLVNAYMSSLSNERVRQEIRPPRLFHELRQVLLEGLPPDRAKRALAIALRQVAEPRDTHPSLSDRLRALDPKGMREIGVCWPAQATASSSQVEPEDGCAAETFLGAELNELIEKLDEEWCEHVRPEWEHHHRVFLKRLADLDELQRTALERDLTEEESWKRIQETVDLKGSLEGLGILRPFAETHPAVPEVRFLLGRVLLAVGDDAGIGEIEEAMRMDPQAIVPGCALIENYFLAADRDAEATAWRPHAQVFTKSLETSRLEREEVEDGDQLLPHDLPHQVQKKLCELFASLPLRRVMMARKRVEHFPSYPVWILGYSVRARSGMTRSWDLEESVAQRLEKSLESMGDVIFFALESRPELAKALEQVESSVLFHDGDRRPTIASP